MGDVYMLNGKILSGLPNHAKDIVFDNTGTTLSSTNTEDAIKEVNSKYIFQSATFTITGDGTHYYTNGSTDITLTGYTPKLIGNVNTDRSNIIVRSAYLSGNNLVAILSEIEEQVIATSTTTTVSCTVLYEKQ